MSYPDYTYGERIADGTIHILGVCVAVISVTAFFIYGSTQLDASVFAAMTIYCVALILMLSASAAYHLGAHTRARPFLRRIDHAAIYVKIAGTLTPLAVLLGTAFAYMVLMIIWTLALLGVARKLSAAPGQISTGWVPQVALGWLGLCIIIPLWPTLPEFSLNLILMGGIIYTGGVIFYCWETLRYCNAIWHAMVLIATACCFVGISGATAGAHGF